MILREYTSVTEATYSHPEKARYIGRGTSRSRGNVGDPQPTRGKHLEVAPDQGRPGTALAAHCAWCAETWRV